MPYMKYQRSGYVDYRMVELQILLEKIPTYKVHVIRSKVMAMMLCGDIEWDKGCAIRNLSDETLIKELGQYVHDYT